MAAAAASGDRVGLEKGYRITVSVEVPGLHQPAPAQAESCRGKTPLSPHPRLCLTPGGRTVKYRTEETYKSGHLSVFWTLRTQDD